jgi:TIR domain
MMSGPRYPRHPTPCPDFFISYTQADREWAEWIARTLEQDGYSTVLQSWDFFPGSNFVIEMQRAAASALHTIAVLSPDYLNSDYAKAEWAAAFALDPTSNRRRLIPVRVRACEPEGLLKAIIFIDLVDINRDEAAPALLKGIKAGPQGSSGPPHFPVRRAVSIGAVLAVLGAVVNLNSVWSSFRSVPPELYRIRVTVIDSTEVPVDNAMVWSSLGGEPKRIAGGWEFNVPRTAIPKDGLLTVFASRPAAFELGSRRLQLAREPDPALTIRLERDLSAQVRGIVVDSSNRAIAGVRICVVGFESEATATGLTGGFVLPAHAADGQQVQLHVEKQGFGAVTEFQPAGRAAVTVVLDPVTR